MRKRGTKHLTPEDRRIAIKLRLRLRAADRGQRIVPELPPDDPQRRFPGAWVPWESLQGAPSGTPQTLPRAAVLARAHELVAGSEFANLTKAVSFVVLHHASGVAESEARARALADRLTKTERRLVQSTLRFGRRKKGPDKPR